MTLLVLSCNHGLATVATEATTINALHPGQLLLDPSAAQAAAAVAHHSRVHFCGHADPRLGSDRVLVWCKDGGLEAVTVPTLVGMLGGKSLVVLNGCCSDELGGALLRAGVQNVICWETKLEDRAGSLFGEGFWRAMVGHDTDDEDQLREAVRAAFEAAKHAVLSVTRPQASALDVGGRQRLAASVPKYAFIDPSGGRTFHGELAAGVPLLLLCPRLCCDIPALPDHFYPRPDVQNALRDALLSTSSPTHAITPATAIGGTAGLGKSTIAAWCANDPRVWSRFADAVVWLAFGQERAALEMLRDLAERLGLARADATALRDERDSIARLRELLRGRHCLVVLDDVWHDAQVAPFKQLCPPIGSTLSLLLTTRVNDLGNRFAIGSPQLLQPLVASESIRVLTNYSGKSEVDLLADYDLNQLITRCDGLPVMLRSVATLLRKGSAADVLRVLDAPRREQRWPRVPGVADYDYRTLFHALDASLSALAVEHVDAARRCEMLAVFPEDTRISLDVVAALWSTGEDDARETVQLLSEWSLINFEPSGTLGLLDLHRDYLLCRTKSKTAGWHASLIQRNGQETIGAFDGQAYWQKREGGKRFMHHILGARDGWEAGRTGAPLLQQLNLCGCGIDDAGAVALAQVAMENLTHLRLSDNNISDQGIKSFASSINRGTLANLEELWLYCNSIGDLGIVSLSDAIAAEGAMTNLKTVYLQRNPFGDVGMQAFASAIASGSLVSLESIAVGKSHEGHPQLMAACQSRGIRILYSSQYTHVERS